MKKLIVFAVAVAGAVMGAAGEIAPAEKVTLRGAVGKKAETFFARRFLCEQAKGEIYEETVNAFRTHYDDCSSPGKGLWQGEYWGKTMLSAVAVCRLTGDAAFKAWIAEKTRAFIAEFQRPDGYIGTYKDARFVRPTNADTATGWQQKMCWNLWGRKYTIWALYEIYRLTGDRAFLDAATRSLDQMIAMLDEMGLRMSETGYFDGIPSCSILKPLLLIHRETGTAAYRTFADQIVADWKRADGKVPNLIANATDRRPIADWYPDAGYWAKAYEIMSCLEGLVEYHRVTGSAEALDTVRRIVANLNAHELNAVGSVGYFDHFRNSAQVASASTEPCDITHWIRVNRELYLVTGRAAYLDTVETAFLNGFLGGVWRNGEWGAHAVRSHGTRHRPAPHQVGMKHHQCCIDNMARTFEDVATVAATADADGAIRIGLYTDFAAEVAGARVRVTGNYPVGNVVTVKVESAAARTVRLRRPAWCGKMTVDGAAGARPDADGWCAAHLPAGGGELTVTFDMTPRVERFAARSGAGWSAGFAKELARRFEWANETPEMAGKFRSKPGTLVRRGPLLLAKAKLAGTDPAAILDETQEIGSAADARATVKPLALANDTVWGAWELTLRAGDSEPRVFKVCDFASAADFDDAGNLFSIWF